MQKLKLNVESLRVDSFEVEGLPQTRKGTVHGAMNIQTVTGCEYTANCQTGEDCNGGSVPTSPYSCTGCVDYTGDAGCTTYNYAGC
jgi:hypothetical protein